MRNVLVVIIACGGVNYLLRIIPFIFTVSGNMSPYIRRFLDYMPVAALGALIMPGIITSFPDNPAAGIAGAAAAAVTAWFAEGLILPVFSSIGATWIMLHYFAY